MRWYTVALFAHIVGVLILFITLRGASCGLHRSGARVEQHRQGHQQAGANLRRADPGHVGIRG